MTTIKMLLMFIIPETSIDDVMVNDFNLSQVWKIVG